MLEQIKASAGSGKTYTLTRRFLELLLDSQAEPSVLPCRAAPRRGRMLSALSEIMAMTFTNKAAAEMKTRVVETLKKAALGLEEIKFDSGESFSREQAGAWVKTILQRYDSLNIRTIDSLLMLLVRISAVSLDIPPDFGLEFDEAGFLNPLYDELQDLAASGDPESISLFEKAAMFLLANLGMQSFTPKDRIRERVLEAISLLERREASPCADLDELYAYRKTALDEYRQKKEAFLALLERDGVPYKKDFQAFLDKCGLAELGEEKWPLGSAQAAKAGFSDCVKNEFKHLVKDIHDRAYLEFCAVFRIQARKLNLYNTAIRLWPFTAAAEKLRTGLAELYAKSGALPSSRLPVLAKKVLNAERGVPEVCCRIGSRLRHLLIDEFQDTSREQWEAVEPLAHECLSSMGSLHYVGDVKQAIYSWRGGDSSLFDAVAERPALRQVVKTPIFYPLQENWRSAPEIVWFNNDFFSRLERDDISLGVARCLFSEKTYPEEEKYRAAAIMRNAFQGATQNIPASRVSAPDQGFVRIDKFYADGKDELLTVIEEKFAGLFENEFRDRRRPGEIAVLVRKKKEAECVAEWLGNLGVSFMTEHSFSLAANPLIQRLAAFLKFLDYPPDDLNFWNFISGPECFGLVSGIADSNLEDWLLRQRTHGKKGKPDNRPLFTLFRRDYQEAWLAYLEPFYSKSGLMSAYDLVSELLRRYGIWDKRPDARIYLERFLEILHEAENRGLSSPAAFLNFWEEKGGEEKIPAPENPDSVRIMTLHKAKGLEFPVVVMPFHSFSEGSDKELALADVDGLTLLVDDSEDLGVGHYDRRNRSELEKLHLLYVGWTRASEELHLLVGSYPRELKYPGLPKALELLFLGYKFSDAGIYERGSRPFGRQPAAQAAQDAEMSMNVAPKDKADGDEFPDDWMPMQWLPNLKIFRNPVPDLVYDQRVRGILFHSCLENMHIPGKLSGARNRSFEKNMEKAVEITLRSFRLPTASPAQVKSDLAEMLRWFCGLPDAPLWLAEGLPEQSILDEQGKMHRVDLLVNLPYEILVLDYKSGKPAPDHREQMLRYLSLIRKDTAFYGARKKDPRGILVYLDERKLEEVRL